MHDYDELELDYESRNRKPDGSPGADLLINGLDRYSQDAEVVLAAYRINGRQGGQMQQWDKFEGHPFPSDLRDALRNPRVRKRAFNAQFERVITNVSLGIYSPIKNWRCTMVRAFMASFVGGLADIGRQMGLADDFKKMDAEGKSLIRLFCVPQTINKRNPHLWRTPDTNPDEWETFRTYNRRDVIAENAIWEPLDRYPVLQEEWDLYEIDQLINDRGKPVNVRFVKHALAFADRRRAELKEQMQELTGLSNPNSRDQLLPWIMARGYGFNDLGKDTVTKSLREDLLTDECREVLKLRQWAARMSIKKFDALDAAVGDDGNVRFLYQFAGASRTNRWAGRRVQTQNLPRTPKVIENEFMLEYATDLIDRGDYDTLAESFDEPMEIIVGTVRSAFGTLDADTHGDTEFVVNDLSAIESVSLGYIANCKRILRVFREGLDVYKDFGTVWLRKPYDQITKQERNWCKPAMLGGGYRLSGGEINTEGNNVGKKTGLWGYAENMGIFMEREQSHATVKVFREDYAPEVVDLWKAYEAASMYCLMTGKPRSVGPVTFEYQKPFMTIRLPSGRRMFYYKPRIENITIRPKGKDPYTRKTLTYMGISQVTKSWQRIPTHGGKLTENCWTAETLVLTPSGPKPIVEVTSDDLVWDGGSWVAHGGVMARGEQEVIPFGGYAATPEHEVLIEGAWVPVKETTIEAATSSFNRHNRTPVGVVDCDPVFRFGWEEVALGNPLQLRLGNRPTGCRNEEGETKVLRVRTGCADSRGVDYAWKVEPSMLRSLALDARALHAVEPPCMEELRRARHNGLPGVVLVSTILGRHESALPPRHGHRPAGQYARLLGRELPLDNTKKEHPQQTEQRLRGYTSGSDDGRRGQRTKRDRGDDFAVSEVGGLASRTDVRPAGHRAQVFDLLNCGPHHRFTIVTPDGRMFLAHNCVQAFARDVLAVGIRRAHAAGLNLRGHVHDEIITLRTTGDTRYSVQVLGKCMTDPIPWAPGLPLKAAGWSGSFYRKD